MARDPWGDVLEELKSLRRGAEKSLGFPDLQVPFQIPPSAFGDVAFPVHSYAKDLGKPPQEIAERLARRMKAGRFLVRHEAKAGYVNSFLDYATFAGATLEAILSEDLGYGKAASKGRRVIVEHTSINPTGPVHVGRARNSIVGDTLARLLAWSGYDTTREYLVNDVGKQVLTLVWGAENLQEEDLEPVEREREDYRLVRYYRRASQLLEEDEGVKDAVERMSSQLEAGDPELLRRVRDVCDRMMSGILESVSRLGIGFDHFFWEDQTITGGGAREVVDRLRDGGLCQEEDGALYIDMEPLGISGRDTRFFLTTRRGTSLYTTRDLAYHLDKFSRSDEAINVLGEDHKLQFRQLTAVLKLLGAQKEVESVFYAHVGLPEGRLSTRRGRVINLDDLMDEAYQRAYKEVEKRREDLEETEMRGIAEAVGIGAIRYNIAKVQPEKRILFRWEEALSLEGQTAPFLQYSYARACGILRKASSEEEWNSSLVQHPREVDLLKLMARFPGAVVEAASSRRPHQMAQYAYELATTFNLFYRDCPVLQAEKDLRAVRLALTKAFRIVLGNSLDCLGLQSLEEM